jgi:hypothetical protein
MADLDYAPVGFYDDDEELLRNGGYAPVAPPPSDAGPPPSAPPVTSSAPMPAMGSVGDLEGRAAQPSTYHGPDATPPAPRPSWDAYKPPEVHGWGKVGRTLGEMFTGIPQRDLGQRELAYRNATAEYEAPIADQEKEAQTEHAQSQSELERQQTATLQRNGGLKQGLTPEETTIHDLMTGNNGGPRVNPATNQPYQAFEAYRDVMQAKTENKVQKPDQPEQQFVDEYQKAHPGATVAEAQRAFKKNETVRDPGTFTPTYDPKTGALTGAWNPQTGEVRSAPTNVHGTTAPGVGIGTKAADANKKALDPLQGVIDEIAESREFAASPSATNDYGLLMNFIGVTKPESLAKLRLNQNEVSLAKGTRSALGDLEALGKKLENGETLTADQRASMLKTMDVVEKFTRRRIDALTGGAGSEDKNKGGGESGKSVSLTEARTLPQNKGKSDADIRKDIAAHGHKVVD